MLRLLRYEFHKILHSKLFYILFGVSVGYPTLIMLSNTVISALADPEYPINTNISGANGIMYYGSMGLLVLLSIFIAFFMTDDYKNGMIKNVLSRGYSKTEVFFAKYIAGMSASIVYLLLANTAIYLLSSIFSGDWKIDSYAWQRIGWAFASCLCLVSLFLLFGTWFRRPVLAIVMNFILPGAIFLSALAFIDTFIVHFFPNNHIYSFHFLWFPFPWNIYNEWGLWVNLTSFFVTMTACPLIGYLSSRKRDL